MEEREKQVPGTEDQVAPGLYDISGILTTYGVKHDGRQTHIYWKNAGDSALIKKFFTETQYPSSSAFGHFVQLRLAEARVQNNLRLTVRDSTRGEREPSEADKKRIVRIRSFLTELRTVRTTIGETLFGNDHNTYAERVYAALTRQFGYPGDHVKSSRIEIRAQLIADVNRVTKKPS